MYYYLLGLGGNMNPKDKSSIKKLSDIQSSLNSDLNHLTRLLEKLNIELYKLNLEHRWMLDKKLERS